MLTQIKFDTSGWRAIIAVDFTGANRHESGPDLFVKMFARKVARWTVCCAARWLRGAERRWASN
jgi:hypothetical protein